MISVDGLAVEFGGTALFSDISFVINEKDRIALMGKNGAGKSTLMRTILGLQPPIRGKVLTGDGLRPNEIGYLPQQTQVQKDFPASVWEIVLSGCQGCCGRRPFYRRAEKQLAEHTLEKLHIAPLARRCYRELSGGQQQRVLLARALCATRSMLLLDEPTAGLDPKATAELYQLIARLNHQDGITVIMISHDLTAALDAASHILHIGQTVFFGTADAYRTSPEGRLFAARKGGAAQ